MLELYGTPTIFDQSLKCTITANINIDTIACLNPLGIYNQLHDTTNRIEYYSNMCIYTHKNLYFF